MIKKTIIDTTTIQQRIIIHLEHTTFLERKRTDLLLKKK